MNVIDHNLRLGMAAAHAGDKARARTHLLRVLASDPRNETAWLWLSHVMPTTEQALRCIDHLLTLNPQHTRALEARDVLRVRLVLEEAAAGADDVPASTPQRRYFLGEALVEARVITQQHLDTALQHQAYLLQHNKPVLLGDLLVQLKIITREQLNAALVAQVESTRPAPTGAEITRFGEFLIEEGLITRAQLHQGLARQAVLRRTNQHVPLGEVLVQCGYLERLMLHHMLLEWYHRVIVHEGDAPGATHARSV